MLVAITGANSAVGKALVREISRGLERDDAIRGFVACVRSGRAAREVSELFELGPPAGSRIVEVAYHDAATLLAAFEGVDAVVHLPGLLIERRDSSYEQANVETVRASVEAAIKAGVRKLVLVSAVGADPASANRYYRTKGEAEQLVRSSGLPYTIVRSPIVLGPATEGANALRRKLTGRRSLAPGGGHHVQQPIDVDDLARGALRAALPDVATNEVLDLVGPESASDRDITLRAAKLLGRDVRVVGLPKAPLRGLLALRTRLLGPGFSPDALDVITDSTAVDPEPAARALGLDLTPLDTMLRRSLEVP